MSLKTGECKNALCKDFAGNLCGQKVQIWRCLDTHLGLMGKITTLEHNARAQFLGTRSAYI